MKTKEVSIKALQLENGDLIIGCDKNKSFGQSGNVHYVKTSDGIMQYSDSEMLEVYGLDFS